MNEKEFLKIARKEAPRRANGRIDYREYARLLYNQIEILRNLKEYLQEEVIEMMKKNKPEFTVL